MSDDKTEPSTPVGGQEPQQSPEPAKQQNDPPKPKPPWGDDADFNPEKAWKLIENLRFDNTTLKSDRDGLKSKVDAFESEKLSAQEKLEKELGDARTQAETATAEAAKMRAAIKHGLSEEDLDLLGSGTAEEIEARAAKLAARIAAQPTGPRAPAPNPAQGTSGQPPRTVAEQIAAAEEAGDMKKVMALKSRMALNTNQGS